ncbi:MAG: CCA tRNA nucleotidyltransferase [Solirubrobacterales bacterium]
MRAPPEIDLEGLASRIEALPGFEAARAAADRAGVDALLVGGAVRDALLGRSTNNLDLVVVGDPLPLVEALGGDARVHDRFGTATVATAAGPIDVARARAETYERPGALPTVAPAGLDEDLARRDFTVNAIAIALDEPGRPIDPHDGIADLGAAALRVLHDRSFVDDPTRALRAARYASRLGFDLEPETAELIRSTDLETVSADRVEAELRRLASEPSPRRGFELLAEWGLFELPDGAGDLIDAVASLVSEPPWDDAVGGADAVLAAVRGPSDDVTALASLEPRSPSAAVAAARGRSPVELALARALGAAWLDDYLADWRHVRLDISGRELLDAGVPEGPAVGRGLAAALRAKLDGELSGRDDELRTAIDAARTAEAD